ncbi:hypothetical protein PBY51_024083 [Eleginops maclovinus]|uniref:Uncharacterized protein n=1 Tax=Eleginops maclovinus TaxID=56733 RepID=A0AAN7XVS9_ELEMC|nr:hypothetical protein PBY51_024083 [Eleginops maclovinus]
MEVPTGDTCCGGGVAAANGVAWLLRPGWGMALLMRHFPLMPTWGILSLLWILQRPQLSRISIGRSMENAPVHKHLVAVSYQL